jgi:hypothetical protein
MVLIIFAVGVLFVLLVVAVAGWRVACWCTRKMLGIGEYHQPEETMRSLPHYLDDRNPPD